MRSDFPIEEKYITLQIILGILECPDARMQCARAGLEPAIRSLQASAPGMYDLASKALNLLLSYPVESLSPSSEGNGALKQNI